MVILLLPRHPDKPNSLTLRKHTTLFMWQDLLLPLSLENDRDYNSSTHWNPFNEVERSGGRGTKTSQLQCNNVVKHLGRVNPETLGTPFDRRSGFRELELTLYQFLSRPSLKFFVKFYNLYYIIWMTFYTGRWNTRVEKWFEKLVINKNVLSSEYYLLVS